jgi:hypothetical protein
MEYLGDRLGMVFVRINCPVLGHDATSPDPARAKDSAARMELEKLKLGLAKGNKVMLYLDDIQHTHPEFLQKFIALADGTRRIEGVWRGRRSHPELQPLAARDPQDAYRLIRMAQGEPLPASELKHAYAAQEVAEICAVRQHRCAGDGGKREGTGAAADPLQGGAAGGQGREGQEGRLAGEGAALRRRGACRCGKPDLRRAYHVAAAASAFRRAAWRRS